MTKNVGTADKLVRFVVGAVILGLGIYYHSWWGLVGIVLIATGLLGTCLLYMPFKISTYKKTKS